MFYNMFEFFMKLFIYLCSEPKDNLFYLKIFYL